MCKCIICSIDKNTSFKKYREASKNIKILHSLSDINYYNPDYSVNHELLQKIINTRRDLTEKIRKVYPNWQY